MSSNETWQQLAAAALTYAATRDMREAKAPRDAAEADTRARWAERTGKGGESPRRGQGVVLMPFGKNKGTPLNQLEHKELRSARAWVQTQLDDPTKARFRASNLDLIGAINAELGE